MVERAYGREEKQARREAILAAAKELFIGGERELPSTSSIAAAAGLAKGTVYLYFRAKEAIFSTLLLEGWAKVFALLENVIAAPQREKSDLVASFISDYVRYMVQHQELLQLDALRSGVLEPKLDIDTLVAFKRAFHARLAQGGALVESALGLADPQGVRLLMRTHALTIGLWQSLGPDNRVKDLPEFLSSYPDFENELRAALTEYWRGALAQA